MGTRHDHPASVAACAAETPDPDRCPNVTEPSANRPRQSPWPSLFAALFCILCASLLALLGDAILRTYRTRNRGVEPPPTALAEAARAPWGVNVALEQYDEAALDAALADIRALGLTWIRQRFPWDLGEPQPGEYAWESLDRWVEAARRHGLAVIAVLERSPAWARRPEDRDNAFAPPQDAARFAAWAAQVAARYGDGIAAYQVWDQPNIRPHWGDRDVDPAAYAELLSAAHAAIKAAAPGAVVLSAALAPTTEPGGKNLSEVAYLEGMYEAGAGAHLDAVGAKAYGFWSGPEDRRVDPQVLNYARLILLREVMARNGDQDKPVWVMEMGWNALPENWSGQPSPWGADAPDKQADRTLRALGRARAEWPWAQILCLPGYQPAAAADDPVWGLALVDRQGQPTLLRQRLAAWLASPASSPLPYQPPRGRLLAALALLGAGLAVVTWRGLVHLRRLPWATWWGAGQQAFLRLSDAQQFALTALLVGLYALSPWQPLALLALWALLFIGLLRLEWPLLCATACIPFALYHRPLGARGFSLVESLTLLALAAWALPGLSRWLARRRAGQASLKSLLGGLRFDWRGLDGAWLFFLLVAFASLFVSQNRSVSLREFRVVVLESALFYWLVVRAPGRSRWATARPHAFLVGLADALVLSGAVLAVYGLAQYAFGGDTIVAEGVRRIRAVYASPNNLSLVLGRIIPLAAAVALWGRTGWRRRAYGVGAALMVPCLFLTFSRGAWLLGLPAAMLFLGAMRGRRALAGMLAAIVVGVALLVPVAGTARIASLFDLRAGTSLFRVSLWRSALAMIRDHPLTGVGLDNFLYYYPSYILAEAAAEPNLSHPHNIVLDFWTRLGVGGLAALAWFLVAYFRKGWRALRALPDGDARALLLGFMASVVGMLAHGLVDNSYFVVELAFIFALTLGWAQRLTWREEEQR